MGFLRFTFLFFPCWGSKPQVQRTPGSPLSMKEIQPGFLRSFHKRRISGQSTSQKQKKSPSNKNLTNLKSTDTERCLAGKNNRGGQTSKASQARRW